MFKFRETLKMGVFQTLAPSQIKQVQPKNIFNEPKKMPSLMFDNFGKGFDPNQKY